MKTLVVILALSAIAIATRQAQSPPRNASLSGVVVADDANSSPIRRARVMLNSANGAVGLTTVTDDEGRFSFAALPAASYQLSATKAAFVPVNFGAKRPGRQGTAIALADAERRTNVVLKMSRGAVIEGTAFDQNGEPAAGRLVSLKQIQIVNGVQSLVAAAADGDSRTDDRGRYRKYGLAAGEYLVVIEPFGRLPNDLRETTQVNVARASALNRGEASSSGAEVRVPTVGYAPVYFPGTTDPGSASPIRVGAGEERTGADVRLSLSPLVNVHVALTLAEGSLPANLSVSIRPLGEIPGAPGAWPFRPEAARGSFVASAVPPGRYELVAQARPNPSIGPNGPIPELLDLWWGSMGITVADEEPHISLRLEREPTVSGRLVFDDGTAPHPDVARVGVRMHRVAGGSETASAVTAAGTFRMPAAPGTYRVAAEFSAGTPDAASWAVKSITLDGRDITDSTIDVRPGQDLAEMVVTFTSQRTTLTGVLSDASGRMLTDFFIVVFPKDRSLWVPQSRWIAQARPATDGRFSVAGLPPGQYLVAALTDVEPGEWFDPSFLESIVNGSVPTALGEGQQKTLDLRVR